MAEPEGFIPVQPERVVDVGLQLLERETMLGATVWRNAAGDFAGAKDDTISLRLPAYAVANKRALRSTDVRVRSTLHQRKVDISLTHDLQVDIPLTDEEMTLDLESIAREVTAPSVGAIVRGYEEDVAALMAGATYAVTLTVDEAKPTDALFDARTALNDASVPASQRFVVVGSGYENLLLKSDRLNKANEAGSNDALREAALGSLAGFGNIFTSNFLDPWEGYAYHRTAYALATRAPAVPRGVAWGATRAAGGYAIRVMEHLSDVDGDIANIVYHDAWVGTNTTPDHGAFNADGKFIPSTEPDLAGGTDALFVRAVKIDATAIGASS